MPASRQPRRFYVLIVPDVGDFTQEDLLGKLRLRLPTDERTQTRRPRPRSLASPPESRRTHSGARPRTRTRRTPPPRCPPPRGSSSSCFRRRQWDCPRTSDSEDLDFLRRLWDPMGVMTRQLRLDLYTIAPSNFSSSVTIILNKWRQP